MRRRGTKLGELPTAAALALVRVGVWGLCVLRLWTGGPDGLDEVLYLTLVALGMFTALLGYMWHDRRGAFVFLASDVAILLALVYISGGPASDVRLLLFVVPVVAALITSPGVTALVAIALTGAYLLLALVLDPVLGDQPSDGTVIEQAVVLGLVGLLATAVSIELWHRRRRVRELSVSRMKLVSHALDSGDRERRRLAQALHDDALQRLLAARQDLAMASRENGEVSAAIREIDEATALIREQLQNLHPEVQRQVGLDAALDSVVAEHARRAGFERAVFVDGDLAHIDPRVVLSIVRELVGNSEKHAQARHVDVVVEQLELDIIIEVSDDGIGFGPERRQEAVAAGHLGLAIVEERVTGLGGRVDIASAEGRGTRVTVTLPLARLNDGTAGETLVERV